MAQRTTAVKVCVPCSSIKLADDFNREPRNRDGLQSWCKACMRDYNAAFSRRKTRTRLGVPLDTPSFRGKRAHRPEGSMFVNRGYVIVKTSGHHRADRYGWVFQHILVAEEKYGIPITREFTIHHINGDRGDNRPENLDLRWGHHGKGADVLPGLLRSPEMRAIAREVLAQYDD